MDFVAQSVIQQMEAAMKLANHKSSKYTIFIQSAIKFVRNSDPCHFLHLNSAVNKDLVKIKEELEISTTPEMQMTAMRLNSFVNNLANQLHNVSKKMKMESDDLNQLLKLKEEKSMIFDERINLINHQYDLVKPNFVVKNWISETFIANKMKRFKKYKQLKPIVRSTKTAIIQLKCKLYKEGDICIECDSLVFENEFIFENQKFKKTLCFENIRHCFYSGRSGLSFIMKNGKMYLAVFDQEDVFDQMVSKLPFFIHNIGKQVTDDFGSNLKSNISFVTFYQFICGKTFASFKNYPQFPLSLYKETIKDESVLTVINSYLQKEETPMKNENNLILSEGNENNELTSSKNKNSEKQLEKDHIIEEIVEEEKENSDVNLDGNFHEEEENKEENESNQLRNEERINSETNISEKEENQKEIETMRFKGFDNFGVSCQEIFCCPEAIDENFPSEISNQLLNQLESVDNYFKIVEWIENTINHHIKVKTPDQPPLILREKRIPFKKKSKMIYYNPLSKIFLIVINNKKILYSKLDYNSNFEFSEVENLEIPDNSLVSKYENTFIVINQDSQVKTILNDINMTTLKTENLTSQILKIFNDGYYVEYTLDNKIIVYENDKEKQTFYCNSGLISLSSSSLFDLLVFCLENGEILFYNISDGFFINKYKNENCYYQKVLCMTSIGDVAAYDNYKIDVFSVNGFFRRSINIPFNIKFWISLEILGIDTIFVITDYWSLYIVELDSLKEPSLIYESNLPIIGFEFDKVDRTFILIRTNDVILIPSDLNHIFELRDS